MPQFIRRDDLSPDKRVNIAIRALQAKGVYGAITRISEDFACSRLFVYQQLWALLFFFEMSCSDIDSSHNKLLDDDWERFVLLLRLENKASVNSISRTLKCLNFQNSSTGYISQKLQEWGCTLSPTLTVENSLSVVVNADELYAGNQPILITLDPVSFAILKIELAQDCKAATWCAHWEDLYNNGFLIQGITSDRGKGLTSAAKKSNLDWFPDQFHEFRVLKKLVSGFLANQASKAIKAVEQLPGMENWNKAIEKTDSFDQHDYLVRTLFQSLPFLDTHGNFRSSSWICGELTASLELLAELGHKKIKPIAKRLLKRLPEILKYLEKVECIQKKIAQLCPNEERARCFCLLWQQTQKTVTQRGTQRKYHRQEKETWEELLKMELGDEYVKMKDSIFKELDSAPRTSSLVEAVNSLIRPYLNSCKGKITQETLNLILFYHNYHSFSDGKRKGNAPIELLTGEILKENWLETLVKKLA